MCDEKKAYRTARVRACRHKGKHVCPHPGLAGESAVMTRGMVLRTPRGLPMFTALHELARSPRPGSYRNGAGEPYWIAAQPHSRTAAQPHEPTAAHTHKSTPSCRDGRMWPCPHSFSARLWARGHARRPANMCEGKKEYQSARLPPGRRARVRASGCATVRAAARELA